MHFEAHAASGWLLAEIAGGSKRLRGTILAASVLPDLDALTRLWGPAAYIKYHHVLTHNILFAILMAFAAFLFCKTERIKAAIFTLVAFAIHYFGDFFFTWFELQPFWPFSDQTFLSPYAIRLSHPFNTILIYLGFLTVISLGFIMKRTPIELISPKLDERIVNLIFRKKNLACHICAHDANEICSVCKKPVCIKHASLGEKYSVLCSECSKAIAKGITQPPEPDKIASKIWTADKIRKN
jgi:membrane-bound metal-dependent hydrolase YbcI (DUF457 family)